MKVQYNNRVHKIATEIKNLGDLLVQIDKIFGEQLPTYFTLQYKDNQDDNIMIQDNNDFLLALQEVTNKTLKIEIIETSNVSAYNSLQGSMINAQQYQQQQQQQQSQQNQQKQQQQQLIEMNLKRSQEERSEEIILKQEEQIKIEDSQSERSEEIQKKQKLDKADEVKIIQVVEKEFDEKLILESKKSHKSESKNKSSEPKNDSGFYYDCYRCLRLGKLSEDCQLCEGKGKISEDSDLIVLMQAVIERTKALKKMSKKKEDKKDDEKKPEERVGEIKPLVSKQENPLNMPHLSENWLKNSIQPFKLVNSAFGQLKNFIKGKKPLDAAFEGEPEREFEVEREKSFTWRISLKNNGSNSWPQNTQLKCIQGPYQGLSERVESIEPGYYMTFELKFLAPEKIGKEMVNFRLQYDEQGNQKFIGPKMGFELKIVESKHKAESKVSNIICKEVPYSNSQSQDTQMKKAEKIKQHFPSYNLQTIIQIMKDYNLENDSEESIIQILHLNTDVQKPQNDNIFD